MLVGIISAVAGLGIVRGVQGYLFAQSNTETTQKAQLALARMTLELRELSAIKSGSNGSNIIFSTPSVTANKTISLAGLTITLDDGDGNGNILTDSVKSADGFTVTYCDTSNVCTAPPSAAVIADPKLLARIDIRLRLIRPDVTLGYLEFTTSVVPRQTRVQNAPKG